MLTQLNSALVLQLSPATFTRTIHIFQNSFPSICCLSTYLTGKLFMGNFTDDHGPKHPYSNSGMISPRIQDMAFQSEKSRENVERWWSCRGPNSCSADMTEKPTPFHFILQHLIFNRREERAQCLEWLRFRWFSLFCWNQYQILQSLFCI